MSVGMRLPVTTTLGPVVVLSMISLDGVDQVIEGSATRIGATAAPMVAPGPPVRTLAGVPDSVTRNTTLPCPALSYVSRALAGSQSSATPVGVARSRFHGLKA